MAIFVLLSCGKKSTDEPSSCFFIQNTESGAEASVSSGVKVGQSFKFVYTGTLSTIQVYMTSANLTHITLELYQGGAAPEAGTLVASKDLTSGLGAATLSWHEFNMGGIPVTGGIFYYLVVTGYGGMYTVKEGVPMLNPIEGFFWEYFSSMWHQYSEQLSIIASGNYSCQN
jgi:hypothetical protein